MKKILSIVLSLVMLLSVSVATVSAFADDVGSIESTTKQNKIILEVNGKPTTDVSYERDPDNPRKITFTYDGDGELVGWQFPDMEEGVDYEIIKENGNKITILLADDYEGDVVANALVEAESEPDTETTETTKQGEEHKSPKTGAASAAGILAMGAGAAILTALKKKEDAE